MHDMTKYIFPISGAKQNTQTKIFCWTPGLAYLAVLPVLVIFCPLGPTNLKKSALIKNQLFHKLVEK
jgi:hypothetical protein